MKSSASEGWEVTEHLPSIEEEDTAGYLPPHTLPRPSLPAQHLRLMAGQIPGALRQLALSQLATPMNLE